MSNRERSKSTGVNAEDRLASALRENLFRRKAQARARANSGDTAYASPNNGTSGDIKSPETKSDMKG